MRLTDEQHRLIEAAQCRPVEVPDPLTYRVYVLLPAEVYHSVRGVVEARPGQAGHSASARPPGLPSPAAGSALPMRLRDMPLPPEVPEKVGNHCRRLGLRRRSYVQKVEEELKLQYYFGGQYVAYVRSADGPVIVASGNPESEEFGKQLDALAPEARRQTSYAMPNVWKDSVSQLCSLVHPNDEPP
jgi:hypothetical protein